MPCASFDVFDTTLIRRVVAPSEVFRLLGERLAARAGLQADNEAVEEFVHTRSEAERRARRTASREEVTLAEIWQQLVSLNGSGPLRVTVADASAELALESELLGPVVATCDRIHRERAAGHRILFVSDTYFPRDFVSAALTRAGVFESGDGLYLSSELGVTKHSGGLFLHVLATEKIPAHEILHFGDHPISDVERPLGLGLRAEHCRSTALSAAESVLVQQRPGRSPLWLRTAGQLRYARAGVSAPATSPAALLVERQLGPLLSLFAEWVLHAAQTDGVRRLYFASRDARLTWTVCRQLAARRGLDLDCRYLRVSRRSLLLAASGSASARELSWLRRDYERPTVNQLLARLHRPRDAAFLAAWQTRYPTWTPDRPVVSSAEWEAFFAEVSATPFADGLRAEISTRRDAALTYLRSESFDNAVPAGFVDVGWYLFSFAALNRFRSAVTSDGILRGYFLGLRNGRLTPAESGMTRALFRQPAPDLPAAYRHRWLSQRDQFIEHLFGLADHPSVTGYDRSGTVQYDSANSPEHQCFFAELEAALVAYVDRNTDLWAEWAHSPDDLTAAFNEILEAGCQLPDGDLVRALHALSWNMDQTGLDARSVIQLYTWNELLIEAGLRREVAPVARIWPEASWAATPQLRRTAFKFERALRRLIGRFSRS